MWAIQLCDYTTLAEYNAYRIAFYRAYLPVLELPLVA